MTLHDPSQLESWEVLLFRAAQEMSVSETQYETIEGRYKTLETILNTPDEPLLAGAHVFVQGSVGLRTTICPPPGAPLKMATIDADAIVWLPHAGNATGLEVLLALERRLSAGTRVQAKIEQLRRGVRIIYADEKPGFHIDVTPARNAPGNFNTNGHGHLLVADRVAGWKDSSPRPYSHWLQEVSDEVITVVSMESLRKQHMVVAKATQEELPDYEDYVDANPLRAAIKLLKRDRDLWAIRERRIDERPISAITTTLATKAYEWVVARSRSAPMQPIEALFALVDAMPQFIRGGRGAYEVLNPKNPNENFAEKWNRPNGEGDAYAAAFYAWHATAKVNMRMGLQDLGSADAFEAQMNERFGVPRAVTKRLVESLPGTLPGRALGTTQRSLTLAKLLGAGAATTAVSNASAQSVGRLG